VALRAVAVLVASAGIAAAVATLTSGSSSSAPVAPRTSAPAARTEIQTVPAAESASFGILRRTRTATDSFKEIQAGAGPFGANPALARSVGVPRGSLAPRLVSVVPANGELCLRVLLAEGIARWWCQPTALAARGRLIVGLRPSGRVGAPAPTPTSSQFVIGLVPDGVPAVTISTQRGLTRTVAVHSNLYATQIFAPKTISFTLSGHGTTRYQAP
jgi:hypothetical protein